MMNLGWFCSVMMQLQLKINSRTYYWLTLRKCAPAGLYIRIKTAADDRYRENSRESYELIFLPVLGILLDIESKIKYVKRKKQANVRISANKKCA